MEGRVSSLETSMEGIERRVEILEKIQIKHSEQINQWRGAIAVLMALGGGNLLLQLLQMVSR